MSKVDKNILVEMTSVVTAAYVSKNHVRPAELPALISAIHASLADMGRPPNEEAPSKVVPPVSIKKSVTDGYLISMEDGKQYQSLKRHLKKRGLTPSEYRTKWGLPPDYPMVAPGYSARRSALAKSLGFGILRKNGCRPRVAPPQCAAREARPEPPWRRILTVVG